ncbi:MAG: hypothetical protein ACJAQ4_000486 [Cryomorphaceae bacterium]|jgi:hypothetical protein
MKKIGFGLSVAILLLALISLVNVALIIRDGITPYGYGYVVGLVLLFIVGLAGVIVLGRKIFKAVD